MTYSLRTMLSAVAVIALGVAALIAQTRVWTSIFIGVSLIIVVAATIVAVYRRSFSPGVFCGVAWLYVAIVFTSWFPLLHTELPTTGLLIEGWYAFHEHEYAKVNESIFASGDVITITKEMLYDPNLVSGSSYFAPAGELKFPFIQFYVAGQMGFALIFATIANQCTAFLTRPTKRY